jgi:hypothetical protein
MIDYQAIIAQLREEHRAVGAYRYGGMVPAYYCTALRAAIEALKECEACRNAADQAAEEQMKGATESEVMR